MPSIIDTAALQRQPVPVLGARRAACEKLLASANSALARVTEMVATDPGLVIAVLREVNAGRGAERARIGSIESAVNLLGQSRLLNLMRSLPCLEQVCQGEALQAARALWERQRLAGALAAHWAQLREDKAPTECRVTGMCHALGELQICVHHPRAYAEVLRVLADGDCCSQAASERVLGVSFTALGRQLARGWNLPELLEDALTPARHEFYRPLGIMLANELCRAEAQGWYSRAVVACLESVSDYLGWSFGRCSAMVHQLAVRSARSDAVDGARPAAARLIELPAPPRPAAAPAARSNALAAASAPAARAQRQAVLLRAKQAFRDAGAGDVLAALLRVLHDDLGFRRAALFVLQRKPLRLQVRATLGVARNAGLARLTLELAHVRLLQSLLQKPQSLLVNHANIARYDAHLPGELKAATGADAFACMSLFAGAKPLGLMYVDQAEFAQELDAARYADFKRLCALANRALAAAPSVTRAAAPAPAPRASAAARRAGGG